MRCLGPLCAHPACVSACITGGAARKAARRKGVRGWVWRRREGTASHCCLPHLPTNPLPTTTAHQRVAPSRHLTLLPRLLVLRLMLVLIRDLTLSLLPSPTLSPTRARSHGRRRPSTLSRVLPQSSTPLSAAMLRHNRAIHMTQISDTYETNQQHLRN